MALSRKKSVTIILRARAGTISPLPGPASLLPPWRLDRLLIQLPENLRLSETSEKPHERDNLLAIRHTIASYMNASLVSSCLSESLLILRFWPIREIVRFTYLLGRTILRKVVLSALTLDTLAIDYPDAGLGISSETTRSRGRSAGSVSPKCRRCARP